MVNCLTTSSLRNQLITETLFRPRRHIQQIDWITQREQYNRTIEGVFEIRSDVVEGKEEGKGGERKVLIELLQIYICSTNNPSSKNFGSKKWKKWNEDSIDVEGVDCGVRSFRNTYGVPYMVPQAVRNSSELETVPRLSENHENVQTD
jgi:hypothetical protein